MDDVPRFDLYGALGVSVSASSTEIEAAFRSAAKREHPDTSRDPDGATGRMQRLNVARDWLTDPDRCVRYDRLRGVTAGHVDLPDIDPLGAWPDHRSAGPASMAGSSVLPAIGAIALMLLLATLIVGIGTSYLTVAAFALSLVVVAYVGLSTVIGWLR